MENIETKDMNSDDMESNWCQEVGSVVVTLPSWAFDAITSKYYSYSYKTDEEMMAVAIYISARNVEEGTGGPFGCAIYERNVETGEATLVSVGMNRVVPLGNSTLHGETVAIQMAEKKIGSFSLQVPRVDSDGKITVRRFELFTSTEPCAMCLGAILWSGVSRIVCGATKDQASAIGFDEGPVFPESYNHLIRCGIEVTKGVMTSEANKILENYAQRGLIYNRRSLLANMGVVSSN